MLPCWIPEIFKFFINFYQEQLAFVPFCSVTETHPGSLTARNAILLHLTGMRNSWVVPALSRAHLLSAVGFSPTRQNTLTWAVIVTDPRARTGVVWLTELAFIEYDAIQYL